MQASAGFHRIPWVLPFTYRTWAHLGLVRGDSPGDCVVLNNSGENTSLVSVSFL